MSRVYVHSVALMGTVITVRVVGHGSDLRLQREREERVRRAVAWFREVEACCSRFEPQSELSRLTAQVGVPVRVSDILYRAVAFALSVAEASLGAFDPTVGHALECRGFNREYRSGRLVRTEIDGDDAVTFRDVWLDPDRQSITLLRPLLLDLGAVAKGLAVDLARRELEPLDHFTIDAGGDLYLRGRNQQGAPWSVGIRHPRDPHRLIETLRVSDQAVCTSGDYERRSPDTSAGHIMDPRTGAAAAALASVTVFAPSAMVADALSTAAFVLGPVDGLALLEAQGVDGLLFTPALERIVTAGGLGGGQTEPAAAGAVPGR